MYSFNSFTEMLNVTGSFNTVIILEPRDKQFNVADP